MTVSISSVAESSTTAKKSEPWWYYGVVDPYERVNVWSHGIPGLFFVALCLGVQGGWVDGHGSFAFFCMCAAITHLISATTHLFPKNKKLQKLDHIGIVALVVGTPLSALWVIAPQANHVPLWGSVGGAFGAAFLPRLTRTYCFIICGAVLSLFYVPLIFNYNIVTQIALYFSGGICFIRNGGHSRPHGCTDHHFLHYLVTLACTLHCLLLMYY